MGIHSNRTISFTQSERYSLRLVGPDVVGNVTDKLKLVDHAIPINSVTLTVRSETTLRANTDLVQGCIDRDVVALSNDLGSVEDALLHLLLVFHGSKLAGHNTENDVLVSRQVLQGLEATGTLGIVLQIVGVHVQLLEKLDGNSIITTLGEVTAADEVTAAKVNSDVHILGETDEGVVVQLDVLLEHVVGGVDVQRVLLEAGKELLRAEVCFNIMSNLVLF